MNDAITELVAKWRKRWPAGSICADQLEQLLDTSEPRTILRHMCGAELDRLVPHGTVIEDCPICDTLAKDAIRMREELAALKAEPEQTHWHRVSEQYEYPHRGCSDDCPRETWGKAKAKPITPDTCPKCGGNEKWRRYSTAAVPCQDGWHKPPADTCPTCGSPQRSRLLLIQSSPDNWDKRCDDPFHAAEGEPV